MEDMAAKDLNKDVYIKNRKARYNYELLDKYEAGIALLGSEVKSIRNAKVSINEAYCYFRKDELYIRNMHVGEYENAGFAGHEPLRERKLLLHRQELKKIQKKLKDEALTLIPTALFFNSKGFAKLEIAVARGKKLHDKRQDIKSRDIKREIDRAIK
jgi:SsrA-binding protein